MASAGDVFDHGRHGTSLAKIEQATRCCATSPVDAQSPPKPLLVAAPCDAGEYAVVVFLHGYLCNNYFYSQLLQHVASHGFIVIAPQLYTVSGPDTTGEINSAAAVIDWLAAGLSSKLPPGVRPNLTAVSISGHSRGGKVAFALGLGHAKTSLPLAALIAVDPVDGTGMGNQTPPPILAYKPNALRVPAPVMVIGTGLGELPRNALFPPCAPLGVSHAEFYDECAAPACHLVARDYGHTDMMDDGRQGVGHARPVQERRGQGAHEAVRRRRHGGVPQEVGRGEQWRSVGVTNPGAGPPFPSEISFSSAKLPTNYSATLITLVIYTPCFHFGPHLSLVYAPPLEGKPEWLDAMREQTVVAPVVLSVVEFRDE